MHLKNSLALIVLSLLQIVLTKNNLLYAWVWSHSEPYSQNTLSLMINVVLSSMESKNTPATWMLRNDRSFIEIDLSSLCRLHRSIYCKYYYNYLILSLVSLTFGAILVASETRLAWRLELLSWIPRIELWYLSFAWLITTALINVIWLHCVDTPETSDVITWYQSHTPCAYNPNENRLEQFWSRAIS